MNLILFPMNYWLMW